MKTCHSKLIKMGSRINKLSIWTIISKRQLNIMVIRIQVTDNVVIWHKVTLVRLFYALHSNYGGKYRAPVVKQSPE